METRRTYSRELATDALPDWWRVGKRRVIVVQWSGIWVDNSNQKGYTGITRREGSDLPRGKAGTEVEV